MFCDVTPPTVYCPPLDYNGATTVPVTVEMTKSGQM